MSDLDLQHEEYKITHNCIPVRSDLVDASTNVIEGARPIGKIHSYFIGIRPKELTEYSWPQVTIHTAATTTPCIKLSSRPYDEIIFLYTLTNSIQLVASGTDYGGAKVPEGHLFATIRSFIFPDPTDPEIDKARATPIPCAARVLNGMKLATEEEDLKEREDPQRTDARIIRVGLLEAQQISINSTLAKCNINGKQSVFIKNSALYESVIESKHIIHIGSGFQGQVDMTAPFILIKDWAMLEGENSSIEAEKWFVADKCKAFEVANTGDDKYGLVEVSNSYGLVGNEIETLCVTITGSKVSGCNISSPQMSLVGDYLQNSTISCLGMNEDAIHSRQISGTADIGDKSFRGLHRNADDQVEIDNLRSELILSQEFTAKFNIPECSSPLYRYNDQGDYWSEECIAKKSDNPGQRIASDNAMLNVYPYAQSYAESKNSRTNVAGREGEPYTQKEARLGYINDEGKFIGTSHGFRNNTFSDCSIVLDSGILYSYKNSFTNNTALILDQFAIDDKHYLTHNGSLLCNSLYAYAPSVDDVDMTVSNATADIGNLYSVNLIAKSSSNITLHQNGLGFSFGSQGRLFSDIGSFITCTAPAFALDNWEQDIHRGNYTFQNLTLGNTPKGRFGVLNSSVLRNRNPVRFLESGSVQANSISGYRAQFDGEVNAPIINLGFIKTTNSASIFSETITFGVGAPLIHGFENEGVISANTISGVSQPLLNTSNISAITLDAIIDNYNILTVTERIDARGGSKLSGKITTELLYMHANDSILNPDDIINISELIAEHANISPIPEGSTIGEATVSGTICRLNWIDLETSSVNLTESLNYGAIDNGTFKDSAHVDGLFTNSSFSGYCHINSTAASGTITLNSVQDTDVPRNLPDIVSVSRGLGKTLMRAAVQEHTIGFKGAGSHFLTINDAQFSDFTSLSITLENLYIDDYDNIYTSNEAAERSSELEFDFFTLLTRINNLSVSISSVTVPEVDISADSFTINYLNSNSPDENISSIMANSGNGSIAFSSLSRAAVYANSLTINDSGFGSSSVSNAAITDSHFSDCTINDSNCTSNLYTRILPNMMVSTISKNISPVPLAEPIYERTIISYDPRVGITGTPLGCTPDSFYLSSSRRFKCFENKIFEIKGSTLNNGSYTSLGIVSSKLNADKNNNGSIADLKINSCMVASCTVDKSSYNSFVEFNGCSLAGLGLGRFSANTYIRDSLINGMSVSSSRSTNSFGFSTKSVTLQSSVNYGSIRSSLTPSSLACNDLTNVGNISTEETSDLTQSINSSVSFINSTNMTSGPWSDPTLNGFSVPEFGYVQARNITMQGSTNKGIMAAKGNSSSSAPPTFIWRGGNTNVGLIAAEAFDGYNGEGLGPLLNLYNQLENHAGVPIVKLRSMINAVLSQEPLSLRNEPFFFFDYGPYYDLSSDITVDGPKGPVSTNQSVTALDSNTSSVNDFDSYISSSTSTNICLLAVNVVTDSNQYYINGQRNAPTTQLFHTTIKVYKFTGVPDGHPMGFYGALPVGFSYTGEKLMGIRDGNMYYSGTITVTVTRSFEGTVTFDSLYGHIDYRGEFAYDLDGICSIANPSPVGGGSTGDDDPPPEDPPPFPPHPELDPPPKPIGPGGDLGPHGTKNLPTYNSAFGIRIFYATAPIMKQNPETGGIFTTRDIYFVEGIPFQGTNVGTSSSFQGYIFDQIIYPEILSRSLAIDYTELEIPVIHAERFYFFQ